MKEFKRYAIYYLPQADSALAQFGSMWLGWDVQSGTKVPYPSWVTEGHANRVATPVKYGFHGTIKPPMRLAGGESLEGLQARLAKISESHAPVSLPALKLKDMGGFLCFTLSEPSKTLQNIADICVRELDDWRERPTPEELNRRRASGLNAQQEALLTQWGYPYVMDEFRFHLTLTGKLPDTERAEQFALLQAHTHELTSHSVTMSDLCLCGESDTGRFHLIERYALTG